MRIIYKMTIASLCLIACHSSIKHDEIITKSSTDPVAETSSFPIPNANRNTIVDTPDDLIGYWVGDFNISYDSTEEVDDSQELADEPNKINISIDSIIKNKVVGHTVLAGRLRKIYGECIFKDGKYDFSLQQPGDDKYDGSFNFSINKNDNLIKGKWTPFKKDSIANHEFKLKKKFFTYNANQELEGGRYGDWKNTKTKVVKVNNNDSDSYKEELYLSTTDDLFKYNASKKLLTAAQASNLKKADIIILRNSIYARHGFAFKRKQLSIYFDSQDWYFPVYGDVGNELTDIEKKNIALLMKYEKNAKAYYDRFGR